MIGMVRRKVSRIPANSTLPRLRCRMARAAIGSIRRQGDKFKVFTADEISVQQVIKHKVEGRHEHWDQNKAADTAD